MSFEKEQYSVTKGLVSCKVIQEMEYVPSAVRRTEKYGQDVP